MIVCHFSTAPHRRRGEYFCIVWRLRLFYCYLANSLHSFKFLSDEQSKFFSALDASRHVFCGSGCISLAFYAWPAVFLSDSLDFWNGMSGLRNDKSRECAVPPAFSAGLSVSSTRFCGDYLYRSAVCFLADWERTVDAYKMAVDCVYYVVYNLVGGKSRRVFSRRLSLFL